MAPSKIESFLFAIVILLAVPYMLFSIRLHAHSVNPDSGSIPTDHIWRLNSLKRQKDKVSASENIDDYPLSYVLKPGREAVELWLNEHRDNFPSFVTSNIPRLFPDANEHLENKQLISNEEIAKYATDATSKYESKEPSILEPKYTDVGSIPTEVETLQQKDEPYDTISHSNNQHGAIEAKNKVIKKNSAIRKKSPPSESGFVFDSPLDGEWLTKTKKEESPSISSKKARCLLFTMDSIDNYIEKSKRGGASGEITIRESLVGHLESVLNVKTDVARSDKEFDTLAR